MVEYTTLSKKTENGKLKAVFIKRGDSFALRMEEDYGDHGIVNEFIEFNSKESGNEKYKELISDGYAFEGKHTFDL